RTERALASAPPRRTEAAAPLSERELVVLRLLPTELSTQEIGRQLSVSVHTVRSQVQAIYRKLQASTRAEAVYQAAKLGLLSGGRGPRPAAGVGRGERLRRTGAAVTGGRPIIARLQVRGLPAPPDAPRDPRSRSEEHTSELQ